MFESLFLPFMLDRRVTRYDQDVRNTLMAQVVVVVVVLESTMIGQKPHFAAGQQTFGH